MNKLRIIALTIGLGGALASANAGKPTGDLILVQQGVDEAPARLLDYQAVIRGLGTNVRKTLADGRIVVVRPPKNLTWQQYQTQLRASGMFDSVEPDTYVTPCGTVNDPQFPSQWHLHEISVQRAWDFTFGGNKVVAVVDGGVDLTHPDLMANLVPGYNVLTSQTQVSGGVVSDVRTNGHGTRIAGVAAAVGNNGIGVSGVGPNLKIMPVRVTDDATQGIATRADLLSGTQWAVQNGATAVNVSYTGVENADVEAMGAWARTQGAFLVWAAGNANTNWTDFDHENVTVVGGLDREGNRWVSGLQGSGYGRGVDIWAPCLQILTTSRGGGYGNAPAGTSFAVPQVAAALALMKDQLTSLDANRQEYLLFRRALNKGSIGLDNTWGWGRMNVGKAVENPERKYAVEFIPVPQEFASHGAYGINDAGTVVGWASYGSGGSAPYRGWIYKTSGEFTMMPLVQGHPSIQPTRIKNNGDIVFQYGDGGGTSILGGIEHANGNRTFYPFERGHYLTDINSTGVAVGTESPNGFVRRFGLLWPTPMSPSYFMGNFINLSGYNTEITAINDSGLIAGSFDLNGAGGDGAALLMNTSTLQQTALPAPYWARTYAYKLTESGFLAGYSRIDSARSAHRWRIAAGGFAVNSPKSYGGYIALDVNEDGDTVGADSGIFGYIFDGIATGKLQDSLIQPLPGYISKIPYINAISTPGDVAGSAFHTNGSQRAYVGRVVDGFTAAVSLGQLGESPTYIGSIPPALSVTFTNEAGVPYSATPTLLTYAGSIGRLQLEVPASVSGPYRVFMRCNASAIPSYEGPTFLSKMYPPLGEPAAPIDTSFLPFDGPLVGGSPTILMYAGDVDNSGEIDAADIDVVIANFGTVNGDPNWNYAVDVDGTGEIDAADIDLVIANFGLTGDPEP